MNRTETYHVVCRDCRLESLTDTADEAERLVDSHESETGHRLAYGRVI